MLQETKPRNYTGVRVDISVYFQHKRVLKLNKITLNKLKKEIKVLAHKYG